ncbi:hypothetical protein [Paraburkholderia sp.]|uniref:hypothetical protein n=1 Tax=Paraburkholderia sp. TaxID=1926495 RepID=UPI003D6E385F
MKLPHGLDVARKRIAKVLHLDELEDSLRSWSTARSDAIPQWVIVYRTAQGFCCLYDGVAVDFQDMLDVQIWAEEMDVQTYYIGL